MTDTTNTRDQIGTVVHDAHHGLSIDAATDRIIAIVREALLSETSVRWAASSMANRLADMVESGEAEVALGEAITAEVLLELGEAALQQPIDAAFGDQQP